MRALLTGDYTAAERLAAEASAAGGGFVPFAGEVHCAQRVAVARDLGVTAVLEAAEPALRRAPVGRTARHAALALLCLDLGRSDEACDELERAAARDFDDLAPDGERALVLCQLAEVCAVLGDRERAGRLRDLLLPHARWNVLGSYGAVSWGAAARSVAVLSTVLEDYDAAEGQLVAALDRNRSLGAEPWVTRTQLDLAYMLCARRAPGDVPRARALVEQASSVAVARDLAPMAARAEALADRLDARVAVARPDPPTAMPMPSSIFRSEGEFWTIAYAGQVFRLRHTRGLGYLAQLLWNPGREMHVTALVGDEPVVAPPRLGHEDGPVAKDLGDAGEVLDSSARSAYRRRFDDLREEIEEARELHDLGRAERAQTEMEMLAQQLAGGGRGRRVSSHSERARLTVTKGIGAALERIAKHHPPLGRHLAATIRRGYYCVYVPDPRLAILWER
jgi:non-specific serine/threonine protein kinase